jgi:RNA polymerase sigma factor (sigma-70 family)
VIFELAACCRCIGRSLNPGAVRSVTHEEQPVTPPPPAEQLASRIFLGPALRTQPDRRLVTLVREGYETAFEEIVRRYRRPLDRFAASFVGGRSEDVTQDAFSKALLALRGSEAEIELRPWLYRIVRNTALNDLRDRPPSTEQLGEALTGGRSAAEEVERREEMAELMERLQALPEPQRAAIVMRELEGLSHEEIATSLGLSGGAARQVIYRARQALRDGLGVLVPLPLLRALFDHGTELAGTGASGAVAAGAASAGGGSGGAILGGIGAGGALKVGVATALIAGSVGAGVAMQHDHGESAGPGRAAASATASSGARNGGGASGPGASGREPQLGAGEDRDRGERSSGDGERDGGPQGHRGPGGGTSGGGDSGHSGSSEGSGDAPSGEGSSGESHSGRHSSGDSGKEGGDSSGGPSGSGGGGSHGGSDGGGSGGGGEGGGSDSSDGPPPTASPAPVVETPPRSGEESSGSGDSGSSGGSGSSGSGSSGSGGGSDGGSDDS